MNINDTLLLYARMIDARAPKVTYHRAHTDVL